jgi:hypothetical protein
LWAHRSGAENRGVRWRVAQADLSRSRVGRRAIGLLAAAVGGLALMAPSSSRVEPWKPVGISSPQFECHAAFDPLTGELYFVRSSQEFRGWRIRKEAAVQKKVKRASKKLKDLSVKGKKVKGGAYDTFANFGDIKGESTDKGHKDWVEVMNYSQATTQPFIAKK